jgi:hypothetical protein
VLNCAWGLYSFARSLDKLRARRQLARIENQPSVSADDFPLDIDSTIVDKDAHLDGGLYVPHAIWTRLYKWGLIEVFYRITIADTSARVYAGCGSFINKVVEV